MEPGAAEKAAADLLAAYGTGDPIQPLTTVFPDLSVADAYAIQRHQIDTLVGEGAVVKGHKVGLTSAAMRRQLGVDQPDYARATVSTSLNENVRCAGAGLCARSCPRRHIYSEE